MAKNAELMEKEIQELKKVVERLSRVNSVEEVEESGTGVAALMKYMLEERERTNRMLRGIGERLKKLEQELNEMDSEEEKQLDFQAGGSREVPLSSLDAKILELAQSKGLICADDVKAQMSYKGRNAACARLNRLYRAGLLDRFQLGHKVYFKYDAGKTTNTALIISPPQ
ncbi:MAG: hypothetical protein KGH61_02235 [Candidatus Micrarchaeota archaeon]|nr:hypothetical protein [Candidatus Micrarchaeota archaeon]MDE1847747.1 hypothetical protein [Candidatus Micrarchaeota archaeon]MDE1863890.1 hypothetical protein [Candidatus Micrarchaeota archaeon]